MRDWKSCHHLPQCFIPLPVLDRVREHEYRNLAIRFLKASWTRRRIVTESYGSALGCQRERGIVQSLVEVSRLYVELKLLRHGAVLAEQTAPAGV
jgi:hypothetical protein